VLEQYDLAVVAFLRNARAPPPSLKDAMAATEAHYNYINLRVQVVSERAGTEAALKALGAQNGGAPRHGGGGQYGGGPGQQYGGAQHGGGQHGAGAQQGGWQVSSGLQSGAGGHQAGGRHQGGGGGGGQQSGGGGGGGGQQSGGGGNGSALLRFAAQPGSADFSTFMEAMKLLTDNNGVVLSRNAVFKLGGCANPTCPGWHPQRNSREAKTVLDAVKAAVPHCAFIAL